MAANAMDPLRNATPIPGFISQRRMYAAVLWLISSFPIMFWRPAASVGFNDFCAQDIPAPATCSDWWCFLCQPASVYL